MLIVFMIHLTHIATFFFAGKSNVNGGIISTIFSSSCVFTSIIFYCKYGQRITRNDIMGTVFIMLCVTLISIGGGGKEETQVDRKYLILALVMALITGVTLSLNTVNINYVIKTGFNLDQANYDGNLLIGLLYLPFCFLFRDSFDMYIYLMASLTTFAATMGVISFSRALKYGKAGPVTAIENSKTIV